MPYLSDSQYLAVKKESSQGDAVLPSIFMPLVSESVRTVVNHTPDRRIRGNDWKSSEMLRGGRQHEGDVVILADPDNVGHLLNMVLNKGTTTGDATDGYTHPFTVGDPQSYTIEISKGAYAVRYFGVLANELKLDVNDGSIQATASICAMGQFSVATLGVALTGSAVTEITLDDEYDLEPTRGLVAGDVLVLADGTEVTVSSVSGKVVTITSASPTAAVGTAVYLKKQSATFSDVEDPFYLGNLFVGFGDDESAATTAAGARSTATAVYDFTVTLRNNLFKQNGSNRIDPSQVTPTFKEAMISINQLLENEEQRQAWLDRSKQAITFVFNGKNINPDFSTSQKLTLKFNQVKLTDNADPLAVGEFIMTEQEFEALYDATDGQAMEAELINEEDGTNY